MEYTAEPKDKTGIDASGNFILLGEDDVDDQEILQEIFNSVAPTFHLQFINNGKKLVSHLEETKDEHLPCLILLDYNMPELNGAEILANLNANHRLQHVPKVIWSTSNAPAYKKTCLELGASDYLVKPSKINALEEMVRHIVSYCDGK